MNQLNEKQVQRIETDLKDEGVEMRTLLEDLVDHLCSSIEAQMDAGLDFDTAYARSRERLISGSAREIQDATQFILQYYSIVMIRKILYFSTFAWLFLWLSSALLGMMGHESAGQLSMLSGVVLGLVSLPSYILYRQRQPEAKSLIERLSIYAAFPVSILMTFGCVFKMMHWPGANNMLLSGLVLFTAVFLPLVFLFSYFQKPELQSA